MEDLQEITPGAIKKLQTLLERKTKGMLGPHRKRLPRVKDILNMKFEQCFPFKRYNALTPCVPLALMPDCMQWRQLSVFCNPCRCAPAPR
jgi:hypothetical protein